MSIRFARGVRLRSRTEFDAVQRGGRRVPGRFFTVLVRPNALACDRLGIIASRRVGGAVVRNRAKRRLRELFRCLEPDTAALAGRVPCDFVIVARRELVDAPFAVVAVEFNAALRRARGAR